MPHIERVDAGCPVPKHAVCEAACGRADVRDDAARWADLQIVERPFEFEAPPRHVRMVSLELQAGIGWDALAHLLNDTPTHCDFARFDERTRAATTGHKPAIYQHAIDALPGHSSERDVVVAARTGLVAAAATATATAAASATAVVTAAACASAEVTAAAAIAAAARSTATATATD